MYSLIILNCDSTQWLLAESFNFSATAFVKFAFSNHRNLPESTLYYVVLPANEGKFSFDPSPGLPKIMY